MSECSGCSGYNGKPVARNLNSFELDLLIYFYCDLWKIVLFKRGYACLLYCIVIFSAYLPKIKLKFWERNVLIERKIKFGSASFWVLVLFCYIYINLLIRIRNLSSCFTILSYKLLILVSNLVLSAAVHPVAILLKVSLFIRN